MSYSPTTDFPDGVGPSILPLCHHILQAISTTAKDLRPSGRKENCVRVVNVDITESTGRAMSARLSGCMRRRGGGTYDWKTKRECVRRRVWKRTMVGRQDMMDDRRMTWISNRFPDHPSFCPICGCDFLAVTVDLSFNTVFIYSYFEELRRLLSSTRVQHRYADMCHCCVKQGT